jgi:uncharacterized protein YndB with AHSA1/START domain
MREDFGTQLEDGSLRFVRNLPGPIERVWEYLVDPEKRALWFCGGTMGSKPGDGFTMAFNHDDISHEALPERYATMQGGVEMTGKVVAVEPPGLLVLTWDGDDEETRFELSADGDRVRLVLIQSPPHELFQIVDMACGWHAHVGILIDQLSGDTPRGFWTEHEGVEAHYRDVIQPPA